MADPITGFFIKWICGKLADKVLARFVSDDTLSKELDEAIKKWAKALPENMYVNPAALFSKVEPSTTERKRPCYHNVQHMLIQNKLPAQNDWREAFLESWRNVKETVTDPQSFFLLSEQTASDELTKLAEATYEVCKQNERLFKSHVIDKLEEMDRHIIDASSVKKPSKEKEHLPNIPYSSIGNLFKGREEILEELRAQAGGGKATAITQTIQGLGGIGKTRLAIEFAWWAWENKKYGAVFFVSSETPEILNASLASLAGEDVLGLGLKKQDEQIASVMRWLRDNHRWLLIFDNADTKEAAQAVEEKLPQLSNGRVIITSRYTRWSAAVSPKTLGLLEEDKAREFLLDRTAGRRIPTEQDEELSKKLAEGAGYLPLLLEQMAAYIAHNQCSMAEYLQQWENEREDVLKWYDQREMQYDVSVAVTWQRTFDQLDQPSRAVLLLASFLAPEVIPTEMFEKSSDIVNEAMNLLEGKKPTGKSKLEISAALSELSAYSMITRQQDGFTVHRILQEVIRTRIPQDKRRAWIEKALRIVNDFAPTDSGDVRTWPVWDALRPHAETIAKKADEVQIAEPTSRLMSVLGTYLHYKGLYHESEPLMQRAVKIFEKSLGQDHPNVATALNNLAQLYQATNRLKEAEPLMQRALEIDEAALGKDHPTVAIRLNNLAQLYQATNRLKEAEPLMQRALKIDEASLGKDHPKVATRLNNLAVLYKATNRLKEAEPLMQRALAIDEASFGKDHPDVAIDLNNLAALYQATNRLKEAEPLIQRALKIDEASFGKDHPKVAIRLNNLAQLYQATNRLKEAEPLLERVVKIFENSLGEAHPNVATALNNLAMLYQDTNRLKEAEPLMKRALNIDEASLGKDHPKVAIRLNNLAVLYQATNRLKEAEPLMERHLVIFLQFTRRTGHPHPNLQDAIENYRGLLMQMGHTKDEVAAHIKRLAPEIFESTDDQPKEQ